MCVFASGALRDRQYREGEMYHGRLSGGIAEGVPRLWRSPECLFGFPALTRWANLRRTNGARRLAGGVFTDGFFGEKGLLADAIGDIGKFALVGADGG